MNAPRLKMVDADCIRAIAQQVVRDVAQKGNAFIVGRGAAYYLHDRTDALHVFIYAPLICEERPPRSTIVGNIRNSAFPERRKEPDHEPCDRAALDAQSSGGSNTVAEGRSDRADAMYDELVELIYKHSR